jgi:hypothetical protein
MSLKIHPVMFFFVPCGPECHIINAPKPPILELFNQEGRLLGKMRVQQLRRQML